MECTIAYLSSICGRSDCNFLLHGQTARTSDECNELVIQLNGDVELAKEKFDAEMHRREFELNIISSIIGCFKLSAQDD